MAKALLIGLVLLAGTTQAQSALYQYRDADGVVHLANYRPDSRYQRVAPAAHMTARPDQRSALRALIDATALDHGLDHRLLHAMIAVESGYDPTAVSPKGAIGLMQVMPATGARFGADDLNDPRQNLAAGARYLKSLLMKFDGNLPLAIAAYNAGEGAVVRYRNAIPPFAETRGYVARVLARYRAQDDTPFTAEHRVLIISGDEGIATERW
jgi:soluble lytic murein transglycosylase-like protein